MVGTNVLVRTVCIVALKELVQSSVRRVHALCLQVLGHLHMHAEQQDINYLATSRYDALLNSDTTQSCTSARPSLPSPS